MPLRLGLVGNAIEQMMELVAAEGRSQWLDRAQQLLHDVDPEQLRVKLDELRSGPRAPWLAPTPVKSMDGIFFTPDCPARFSVVATDGSSIPPDRHRALCTRLFGWVLRQRGASFESRTSRGLGAA